MSSSNSSSGSGSGSPSLLQRRRSSSAIIAAPTHSASPKLQAARERLQQPSELQLEPNNNNNNNNNNNSMHPLQGPASSSSPTQTPPPLPTTTLTTSPNHNKETSSNNNNTSKRHHRNSRQSHSLRYQLPPSASSRHHHHHHQQNSSSHSSHPSDSHSLQARTRIITVPVWARNEPPSPFTSPTVPPLTHTLPSLTDLTPLGPALLEADESPQATTTTAADPNKDQPPAQPFQSLQHSISAPPSSKQTSLVLQRFSTRSSTSSNNPSKAHHRSYRKKWLFSRKRTPLGLVPSSPALRPASHSHHSPHQHDSDTDDDDDPDAVGPERFWSFTLPPRYRAKIKDLNTFRMSSFKASTVGRAHQGPYGGQADEEDEDGPPKDDTQPDHEPNQRATLGQGSLAAAAAADSNGETQKDRILTDPPPSANHRPNSPIFRRAPKRHNTSPPSDARNQAPPLGARSHTQAHAPTLQAKSPRTSSFNNNNKSGEPRSRSSSQSAPDSESSDLVRARRTSGDGTGAVGLPRGAAAAELDANALMSWMRRRDSSRSGPGQGGASGPTGARNSPVAPRSPLDSSWHSPVLNRTSTMNSSTAAGEQQQQQPTFTLPRLAEPAHYLEPRQKQHELRMRVNNPQAPSRGGGQPQQLSEKQGGGGGGGGEDSYSSGANANATANGNWDAGLRSGTLGSDLLEFSRHQPRTPGWSTPWRPETPTTEFPFGAAGPNGFGFGTGADPHEHGGLDLEKLGALLGRHSGRGGGGGYDAGERRRMMMMGRGKGGGEGSKYHDYLQRFRTFLLVNPFAPFFFRMLNMTFTTATLAVAIKIHERLRAIGDASLVGSSPILGIIFAPLTLAHVFSQIYMEYFGRPIGLWSVRSKLYYTLIELVFVCFWSAELALAFDNLSTSPLECCCGASRLFNEDDLDIINRNQGKVGYICRLQSTLAGLSFVSLLAYLIVLAVSLFRIFERVSRTPH